MEFETLDDLSKGLSDSAQEEYSNPNKASSNLLEELYIPMDPLSAGSAQKDPSEHTHMLEGISSPPTQPGIALIPTPSLNPSGPQHTAYPLPPEEAKEKASTPPHSSPSWYNLEYYKPYFNLSTETATSRLLSALWPFGPSKFTQTHQTLDLYCPIWIIISLIVILSISGNLVAQVKHSQFQFDPKHFSQSASWLFAYLFINPAVLYFIIKCKGRSVVEVEGDLSAGEGQGRDGREVAARGIGYLWILSVYGYSFIHFIIMALVYLCPLFVLRIVAFLYAGGFSLYFLHKNMGSVFRMYLGKSFRIAQGYVVLTHLAFMGVVRFGIFA
jgi:hypothetical protein